MNGWPIDHVALVVADLDAATEVYVSQLGFEQIYRETIADQGVEALGLKAGDSVIELLRPLDLGSAISRYRGEAASKLHHVAFRVPDLESALADLKRRNVRLIDERPRRGAHGNRIAFIHPSSTGGVLIELCQR